MKSFNRTIVPLLFFYFVLQLFTACPTLVVGQTLPFVWGTTPYGACSASCGGGTQTRTATCQDSSTPPSSFPATACSTAQPATQQSCNVQPCVTAAAIPPVAAPFVPPPSYLTPQPGLSLDYNGNPITPAAAGFIGAHLQNPIRGPSLKRGILFDANVAVMPTSAGSVFVTSNINQVQSQLLALQYNTNEQMAGYYSDYVLWYRNDSSLMNPVRAITTGGGDGLTSPMNFWPGSALYELWLCTANFSNTQPASSLIICYGYW